MDATRIVLAVLFAVIGVLGIAFNALVVLVIRRNRSLRTPMNYLLLNLAISDIIIATFILPRHVFFGLFTHPEGLGGDFLCKFITGGGLIWIGATAEGYTLITIAFERFFAIVTPHNTGARITNRKLHWIVPLCWGINTAVNLPSLASLAYIKKANFCLESFPTWVNPTAYVGFMFVVGISSVIGMFILYSFVLYSLWSKPERVTELSQNARQRARKRVTQMLVLITVFHGICRIPNYTFYLLVYAAPGAIYGSMVYNITVLFILINSTSHPFLLCWHMRTFRQGLRKTLGLGQITVGPEHVGETVVPPSHATPHSLNPYTAERHTVEISVENLRAR